jgi:DNA-binding CsgD family transcriptional regulator
MTRPVLTPVGGLEVEIDDDVVPVIGRLRDALADDAGGGATLGEAVERGLPGGEVGDGVFDVQGRHGSSWSAGSRDGRDVGRRAVSQVVGVLRTLRRWGGPRTGRCWTGPEASRRAIAVTIEPASPEERRAPFCRSCALTPRETEVVGHLATGGDTRDVAHRMGLSEHTVQDHLKSVFTKTATRSRRDLLARITGS